MIEGETGTISRNNKLSRCYIINNTRIKCLNYFAIIIIIIIIV